MRHSSAGIWARSILGNRHYAPYALEGAITSQIKYYQGSHCHRGISVQDQDFTQNAEYMNAEKNKLQLNQ